MLSVFSRIADFRVSRLKKKDKINKIKWGSPRRVVANMLDCDIVESEFELQLRYNVYLRTNTFGKSMNPPYPLVMGRIVLLLFFYTGGFGIK